MKRPLAASVSIYLCRGIKGANLHRLPSSPKRMVSEFTSIAFQSEGYQTFLTDDLHGWFVPWKVLSREDISSNAALEHSSPSLCSPDFFYASLTRIHNFSTP